MAILNTEDENIMSKQALQASIGELRRAAAELGPQETRLGGQLQRIADELEAAMREDHLENDVQASVRELVTDMDVQHPALTRTLDQILLTLSNLGI